MVAYGGIMKRKEENAQQIECLKELRNITGLNQREMSERLGVPLRTWEDWESGRRAMPDYTLRMLFYYVTVHVASQINENKSHNVNIIRDEAGQSIVIINDIRFKDRQHIDWEAVEKYLLEYVGENVEIIETADVVYIGTDYPKEVKGSEDTRRLKGTNAKAKANATTETIGLLQYATNKRWQENYKSKHGTDAAFGWYRFTSRFALPVYSDRGNLERYNIYRIEMLVRHASDEKLYLYDMVNIKKEKETDTPSRQCVVW